MKILALVGVFVVGVFLFSHKPLNLAGLKLANLLPSDDRLDSAVIGRWDQVGSTGFIRQGNRIKIGSLRTMA